ncbi:Hypothetical protein D9617_3g018110 [Elsinoe fawcettii]|nr:Hypothetical protein D9617_3g018110 [Elsinoe fawcettii]
MDDDDLSVLEYARNHKLCRDYTKESILNALDLPPADLHFVDHLIFKDDYLPDLLQINLPVNNERLSIDRAAAAILRDSIDFISETNVSDDTSIWSRRAFKFECPILQTDEVLDSRNFFARFTVDTPSISAQIKSLTPEASPESTKLHWPLLEADLVERVTRAVSNTSFKIDVASLLFLKDAVRTSSSPVPEDDHFEYVRRPPMRMSSPLLPLSPALSTAALDENQFEVPFASTPEDPAEASAKVLHRIIMEDDTAFKTFVTPFNEEPIEAATSAYFPADEVRSPADTTPSPLKRFRPEDFRLDTPLFSNASLSPPFKKVRFDDLLPKDDPAFRPKSSPEASQDFEKAFGDLIDLAQPAIWVLDNEQLQEADTLMRIAVPALAPYLPVAPWDLCLSAAEGSLNATARQSKLLSVIKGSLEVEDMDWRHGGSIRKLRWEPVPYIPQEDLLHEEIADSDLAEYMKSLAVDDQGMDGYFWKPEGIRIFDAYDDDLDDLDPAPYDPGELAISTLIQQKSRNSNSPLLKETLRKRALQSLQQPVAAFGATSALNSFLHLQTGQADDRPPSRGKQDDHSINEARPLPKPPSASALMPPPPLPAIVPQLSTNPLPPINYASAPSHVLISSTLLSSRSLVSQLHTLLPTTTFIERDLTTDEDADLLPTLPSGIILSTLQKIKQRPLPGSLTQLNPVHTRLLSLGPKYETLTVLISEALPSRRSMSSPGLDATDVMAINALTTLSSRLPCEAQVLFVPGGEAELAACLASRVCDLARINALPRVVGEVLQDETVQERWLKRAGLNSFAAAAVLAMMQGEGVSALGRFVMMDEKERGEVLGGLLGRRVLERVGRAVDQTWEASGSVGEDLSWKRVGDMLDAEMLVDDEGEEMLF